MTSYDITKRIAAYDPSKGVTSLSHKPHPWALLRDFMFVPRSKAHRYPNVGR